MVSDNQHFVNWGGDIFVSAYEDHLKLKKEQEEAKLLLI